MCGHGAFIGKNFDQNIFNLIMDANDNDGGDGAGIVYTTPTGPWITKKVCPSDGAKHIFEANYWPDVPDGNTLMDMVEHDLEFPEDVCLVMAHSRKATVGVKSPSFVHPYTVRSDTGTYYVQHNGTVYNYQHIADKLALNPVYGDSDTIAKAVASQVQDQLFSVYQGQATVIWANSEEKDALYIFVGSTKKSVPDKTMFLWHHNEGVYLSKLIAPLTQAKAMCKRKGVKLSTIRAVPVNTVFKLRGTELSVVSNIERNISTPKPAKPPKAEQQTVSFQDRIDHSRLLEELLNDLPNDDKLHYRAGAYYVNGKQITTQLRVSPMGYEAYPRTFYHWKTGKLFMMIDDATLMTAFSKIAADGSKQVQKVLAECEEIYLVKGLLCRNRASWEHLSLKQVLSVTMVQNHVLNPVLASHFDKTPSLSSIFLAPSSPFKNKITGVSSFGLMGPVVVPFSDSYYVFKTSRLVRVDREPSMGKLVAYWKDILEEHKPANLDEDLTKLKRIVEWMLRKDEGSANGEKLKKIKLLLQ